MDNYNKLFQQFKPNNSLEKYLKGIHLDRNSIISDFDFLDDVVTIKQYIEHRHAVHTSKNLWMSLSRPEWVPSSITEHDYFYSATLHNFFSNISFLHLKVIEEGVPIYQKRENGFCEINKNDRKYKSLMKFMASICTYDHGHTDYFILLEDKDYFESDALEEIYVSQKQIIISNVFFGQYENGEKEKEIRKAAFRMYIDGKLNSDKLTKKNSHELDQDLPNPNEKSHLNTIAALVNLLKGAGKHQLPFKSDNEIKSALADLNSTIIGFSERNLDTIFAKAHKTYKDN